MKYLLFANLTFYPRGGVQDLVLRAESLQECKDWVVQCRFHDSQLQVGGEPSQSNDQLEFYIVKHSTMKTIEKATVDYARLRWELQPEVVEWETLE